MEVSPLPIPGAEDGTEQIAAALHAQRRRVREFLSAQQDRLHRAERALSDQLRHIAAETADDRRQTRQTRDELARRSDELQRQAEAIEQMKTDLAARQAEWEKLYRGVIEQQQSFADQLKRQQDEFDRRQQDFLQQQSAAAAEIDLTREKEVLTARLAELAGQLAQTRQELADARAGSGKDKEDDDDLRRRYEMSIDDLRELRARNEELQEQLASARRGGGGNASQISSGVLNWEAEKKRILAALEADFEEDNEEDRQEKLKIQEVIRRTDRVAAEKNREIGELRALLESQASNIGTMAVGAAALGQILDTDAVIQEERKNLARLQEEWRDKLRQAEIEISLERAKNARERSQLDEKLRALEQQGVNPTIVGKEKEPAKPTRGRWLARLGLTGSENEQENGT